MKKYILGAFLLLALFVHPTVHADTAYPDGCTATTAYSSTTGHPCTLPDCAPGDAYSALTGLPCGETQYLPGCYSTDGFSVTTGTKCDGSVPAQTITNDISSITTQAPSQTMDTQTNTQVTTPADIDNIVPPVQERDPAGVMENPNNIVYVTKIATYDSAHNPTGYAYNMSVADTTGQTNDVYVGISNLAGAQQLANQYVLKQSITSPIIYN